MIRLHLHLTFLLMWSLIYMLISHRIQFSSLTLREKKNHKSKTKPNQNTVDKIPHPHEMFAGRNEIQKSG